MQSPRSRFVPIVRVTLLVAFLGGLCGAMSWAQTAVSERPAGEPQGDPAASEARPGAADSAAAGSPVAGSGAETGPNAAETGRVDLQVESVSPVASAWPLFLAGRVTVPLRLELAEERGLVTRVYAPRLTSLKRESPQPGGAPYSDTVLRVSDREGGMVLNPDGIILQASEQLRAELWIQGIDLAGSYSAEVVLRSPAGFETVQAVTFHVREPWWWCALAIALGAGTSLFIQSWRRNGRRRVLSEIAARKLHNEISRALPTSDPIRQALLAETDKAAADWKDASFDATLASLQGQLKAYREIRRILAQRQALATLPDAVMRSDLQGRLDNLEAALRDEGLSGLQAAEDGGKGPLLTQAETLANDLAEEALNSLRDSFEELASRINAARDEPADAVSAELDGLAGEVTQASARLKNATRLTVARDNAKTFDALRERLESALAKRFLATLRVVDEPPLGFETDSWRELVAELEARLPGDYEMVRRLYLRRLLQAAETWCRDEIEAVKRDHGAPEEVADFEKLRSKVHAALAEVESQPDDAEQEYAEILGAAKELSVSSAQGLTRSTDLDFSMSGSGDLPSVGAAPAMPRAARMQGQALAVPDDEVDPGIELAPLATLYNRLQQGDWKSTVAVIAISVLIGVETFWSSDPAWGSLDNILAAFLWGFSLDVVKQMAMGNLDGEVELPALPSQGGADGGAASQEADASRGQLS